MKGPTKKRKARDPRLSRTTRALAPEGRADRLQVSLSPDDRAGLEVLVELWSHGEGRAMSMAEVVRELIREAVAKDREIVEGAPRQPDLQIDSLIRFPRKSDHTRADHMVEVAHDQED